MCACSGDAEELRSEAGSGLSSADSALEGVLGVDEGDEGGSGPRERHQCVVCGITTTSAAHLEVRTPLAPLEINTVEPYRCLAVCAAKPGGAHLC